MQIQNVNSKFHVDVSNERAAPSSYISAHFRNQGHIHSSLDWKLVGVQEEYL